MKNTPNGFDGRKYELPQNYNIGVPEFLYLIQNASIVVSSSFHGVAFAINFGRPLIALAKENEDDRVSTLLNNLDIAEDVLVMTSEVEEKAFNPFYDVLLEQTILNNLREISIAYLKNNLK